MNSDFIPALQSLGYTPREAGFLYLVAAHSGYFVRRQFDYFINRNKGAIVRNFLAKAQAAGHIEVLEYARGWRVYHLLSRSIYRLANLPESPNRQRKGDAAIRANLIALDYVLENRETEHYIVSPEEKIEFLRRHRRLPSGAYQDENGNLLPVLKASLISVEDPHHPATSLVRFLFVDEGLLSLTKFSRVLEELGPWLRWIGNFELIYGSNSDRNFDQAGNEFWRRLAPREEYPGPKYGPNLFQSRPNPVPKRVPIDGEMITIFFKYSYPPLRSKEREGSSRGSMPDETSASH